MNRKDTDDSWILWAAGAFVILVVFCIWEFSTFFGLDMKTGASVILRLVLLVVIAGLSWKFGDASDLLVPWNVVPILVALAWFAWWPALDYWASQDRPSFFSAADVVTIWWDAWYTKIGVVIAIIGIGQLGKNIFED